MRKKFILFLVFLFVISLSFISSAPIDDEFKKLANYAKEYETGNINYVQLLVYSSAIKEEINGILGATNKEMGGILKEEQLKSILGESTEKTKWVWAEKEEKEIKLDEEVSAWKKIIFDGKKIQIRLNSWPSIFGKKEFKEDGENENEKNKELENLEGKLIYRLNFEIEFKKPGEQLNIQSKIDEIQILAQTFNSDSSYENAEALAKESVNAERIFESYFKQSGGKCENIMGGIFGTENKRQTQKLMVQEISFCEGDNFEVIARLEMCDECEWNWINLDFWINERGPGFKLKEEKMDAVPPQSFKDMSSAELEKEIKKTVEEIKQSCNNKDFGAIMSVKNKLWSLNEAWNQKSNDVWKEVDQTFKSQVGFMTQGQRQEFDQNYGWIKQEQEKRQKVKELSKINYETRKQFYLNLFSDYDKKEYYFTQVEFQKRLVEEFRERGEEICDNNKDDNENEAIDCTDDQCGGKVCGKGKNTVQEGNETKEIEVDFYCIEGGCKAREEIQKFIRNVSIVCQELLPIECSERSRVFFSRYDNKTNCPIETSCLEETNSCEVNEDCKQPACGVSECIVNKCELTGLTECRALECIGGDEKICESDGRIVEICNNGFWEKVGECKEESELRNESLVGGTECSSANDCGGDNICNNGVCQVIPQVIVTGLVEKISSEEHEEKNEIQESISEEKTSEEQKAEGGEEQTPAELESTPGSELEDTVSESTQTDSSQESEEITRDAIFNFIGALFLKMRSTGSTSLGFEVEEDLPEQRTDESVPSETSNEIELTEENVVEGDRNQEEDDERREREDDRRREEDERREREEEQRIKENKERCKKNCERPCVEKCIREGCGEELNCVINEMQKKCEGTCEAGDDCIEKCMQGGDWWKEFENKNENKEEKGIFQVGGNCRTSQGKTEGFIWFGGWGDPFEQIQQLKNKYYSGGQADWCKYDFENLKKQRQEFEKGFNQEFAVWFFEKYLTNSAENWEQAASGIFELYWKDIDNSREMAYRMQCLEIDELPNVNLINITYDTDYGSIEFWEEIKTVKLEGMDKEVQVISPYMKVWIFPPKEFIVSEMKKSMKNHEFLGSPEEKTERMNEEGPTEEERKMIKQDEKFMKGIKEISEKYGGNLDMAIQFKDYETNEIVFNLYVQVNEKDILKMEPMLPEEIPAEDVKVEIDFKIIYDLVYEMEKEMKGQMIESPPWDSKKIKPMQKINEIKEGIKMYFKVREIMNSAKITPTESEKDVKNLFKKFMSMMMKSGEDSGNPSEEKSDTGDEKSNSIKEDILGSKEIITGEVVLS
ncbi:MAG: hypothetical protein ABIH28_00830 [archaeon]